MKTRHLTLLLLAGGIAATAALLKPHRPADHSTPPRQRSIERGPLTVWIALDGTIAARRVDTIRSPMPGGATLVELIAEGTTVTPGDPLARFDSSQLVRERLRLEREAARAGAELLALEKAELPMEEQQVQAEAAQARLEHEMENAFLDDSRDLVRRNLISPQEIRQQERRVQSLLERRQQLEQRLTLLREHLHPARLTRMRAQRDLIGDQLADVTAQLAQARILSPAAGVVVFPPLALGSDFRPVRVGDTVFHNQPFMLIPSPDDLLVECFVPESELAGISTNATATIRPLAFPEREMPATVEQVSAMALPQPGLPNWQKFFRLILRLDATDPRLRPGMSADVAIAAYSNPAALRVPRLAVQWEQNQPYCLVATADAPSRRDLRLGPGDTEAFEVLAGLTEGEWVLLP